MMNILITGTSRGIGLEMTRQLLSKGQTVFALARHPDKSKELQHLLREFPKTLRVLKGDVSSDSQVEAAVRELGGVAIDLLINNAGIYGNGENFEKLSLDDVEKTIVTNAVAPMRVTRAVLPNLKKSKAPKVAHITSLMGSIEDNTSGGSYGYRMSKAALNMFHKSFAVDFPKITSLVIHPGWVKTDMGGENAPTEVDESARGILAVIERATSKDSGAFFDFEGERLPW